MAIKYDDYFNNNKSNINNISNNNALDYNTYFNIKEKKMPKIETKKKKKNILDTVIDTVGMGSTKLAKGWGNIQEGIADLGAPVLKTIGKATSAVVDNKVGEFIFGKDAGDYENNPLYQLGESMERDKVVETVSKPLEEKFEKNSLIKKDGLVSNVLEGVGQVAGMALNPLGFKNTALKIGSKSLPIASGTKTMFMSTLGNSYTKAKNEGADDNEAILYGLLSAGKETTSEAMYGGLGKAFGKGALDDVVKEKAVGMIKSKLGQKVAELGIGMTAEGLEEVASSLAEPFIQRVYKEKNDIEPNTFNSLLNDFLGGALVSGVMQGADGVLNIGSNIKNRNKNNFNNNVSQPIDNNLSNNQNFYQYEQSDNSKIDNLRKSASNYFNNSSETKNLINTYEKIISDKNYNIIFDNSITNNGTTVNGKISTLPNGEIEIRVNPNSNSAGEFILMHEVTHAIETSEIKELVMDYASKHSDFNEALESLKQTYGTNDVSSEVLADISGQLFGNQEFINNLSMEKPNVFKRIYNKIIELANKITGNSKESLFIKDLKNKWENAYRTQNNNLNSTKFSIMQDSDGNKYVNVDTNQDVFANKNLYEQTKIAKQYILDNFKGKELSIDDNSANITRTTANEYTHPKKSLQKIDASSKMKASTELDNLLSVSEYKYSKPDDGRHSFAKDGWDYYETTFKVGNYTYTGLVNIAKNGNKKMLYDITNLKRNTLISSPVNTATESIGIPFHGNNIPQSNKNVKQSDTSSSTNYSMQNKNNNVWNNYLNDNYKSSGTKTDLNKIKGSLPTAKVQEKSSISIPKDPTKESSYDNLDNYNSQINNISEILSNYTSLDRSELFSEKTYDSINSELRKMNVDNKLGEKTIDNLTNKVFKSLIDGKDIKNISNTVYNTIYNPRKVKVAEYRNLAANMIDDIAMWNDKKIGLSYQTETMKRNIYDIIPDKAKAKEVYETYFQTISENEAKAKKEVNSYNNRIKELKLNNKESIAVQMYGEYKYNPETTLTGAQVDEFIEKNKLDYNKIKNSVEVFRNTYDELINKVNNVLISQGYKPIEYRKGYFPHFTTDKAETVIGKFAEKLGWKINKKQLPTDIAGMTEIFKPGKTWAAFSQQRTGDYTDYNALKGFDTYIRGAADLIHHTEDIQKLRALENEIRYQYSSDTIKKQIDDVNKDDDLDVQQKQVEIEKIFEQFNNQMPNFVTEIRRYTDGLANKKAIDDRNMEHKLNRTVYSSLTNIQNRINANMVGLNVSSAFTNFIPITQGYSQISTKSMLKAIKSTISNQVRNDGFDSNSTFLTNRLNNPENLYKTGLDKFNDKASFLFEGIDSITSNILVRGKYYDNINKGMNETEAMKNADEFAKDVMAGRSKGEMPTIYNEKNPITKLFTSFQLEVKNQFGYMFKDVPRDLKDKGMKNLIGAFFKMFAGAWLYNKVAESLTGRKSAFSPVDIVEESILTSTNKNLSTGKKAEKIAKNVAQELPFVGGLLGGGRLPINAAIPDVKTFEYFVNSFSDDSKKRTTAINNLKKELAKPTMYIVMPVGGGQLKKTYEGLSMYSSDKKVKGSYTTSGQLRFPVKEDILSKTQAAIFGQYASKEAREYFDSGEKPLTEKQTEAYKKLNVPITKFWQYRQDLKSIKQIKADTDDNGKTVSGSATGKKAYEIITNKNYSTKEKNYLLSELSNSENKETINSLKILNNDKDSYKYYFSLSSDNKKKFKDAIENYNFTAKELTKFNNSIDKTNSTTKKQSIEYYLINSNLNDEQIGYLYNKNGYINDDKLNSLTNSNISLKSYIDIKSRISDIKNNIDSNGKSISGSKKKKVLSEINSTNGLSKEQKLLVAYLEGYTITKGDFTGYDKDIARKTVFDYVNSLKLSIPEKQKILISAGYKILQNGNIGW